MPKVPVENSLVRKIHFEPSTVETIDKSMLNYLYALDLFANTNEGWSKVPVIWGSAERSFQVKNDKSIRDDQGMLRLPIITLRRVSLTKDMQSKGVFQGNIPEIDDEQGGSLPVARVIYQEKTSKFANADALRLHKQNNYPRENAKTVFRTITAPMPVNVTVMYEITIRTEYQQQMNELMLPFITVPGTINYIRLFEGEHRFEGFIQGDFSNNDNVSDFSSDERKFELKIPIKVIGYLVGQKDNRDKPHYSIRENAVEVKIPRERISLQEVPEHEYGAYFGLSGIPQKVILPGFPEPFIFSNVPAAGKQTGGIFGSGDVSGNLVTNENFTETLNDNLVIRQVLKRDDEDTPEDKRTFIITSATIKENTESLYVNGIIQAVGDGNDYTITGQQIIFEYDILDSDSIYITYIVN
jgi:hypothetical protein